MNPLEQKIQELEARINKLERPDILPQAIIEAFVRNGFVRAKEIIRFVGGAAGREFEQLTVDFWDQTRSVGISREWNRFYVQTGSPYLYSNNVPGAGNNIILTTTGTIPSPAFSQSYFVLSDDPANGRFTLDDGTGSPIVFTNTGVGTHYYDYL